MLCLIELTALFELNAPLFELTALFEYTTLFEFESGFEFEFVFAQFDNAFQFTGSSLVQSMLAEFSSVQFPFKLNSFHFLTLGEV